MFEGFKVQFSADRRRVIGRKYGQARTKSNAGSNEPQDSSADAPKDSTPIIGAIILSASRPNIQDHRAKQDEIEREIVAIESDAAFYAKRSKRFNKKLNWWRKSVKPYRISSGIVGFFIGLTLGIYRILHMLDATAGFLNAIGAASLCAVIGIACALLLICISYGHTVLMTKHHEKEIRHAERILKRLENAKKLCLEEKARLSELIRREWGVY